MILRRIASIIVLFSNGISVAGATPPPPARPETGQFSAGPNGPVIAIVDCGEGKLCGRIVALGGLPATDARNPDAAQKSRALCGLEVLALNGSKGTSGDYVAWDGTYYDASKGTTYNVRLRARDKGMVNIYGNSTTLPLTRTYQLSQLWSRVQPPVNAACTAPSS